MRTNAKLGIEQLEARLALAASILEYNDIGYFFDSESNIVQRYDIEQESWLGAIALQNTLGGPTTAHVDSDGIYASFGQSVYRYQLDGSSKTHLINLQSPVIAIHSDSNILFLNYSISSYVRFVSIDKLSNLVIDSIDRNTYYYYSIGLSSLAPLSNSIYSLTSAYSSLQISYLTYEDDGHFSPKYGSVSHNGDYPSGSRSWVFPDESKLLHSSGTIFATSDLRYVNRLTQVDDIDFLQEQIPFVLQGNQITAYSKAFLPTGKVALDATAVKIFVNPTSVVAFIPDKLAGRGYRIVTTSISAFSPAPPNAPLDPTGLAYTPDWIAVSNQARVLLLSKSYQNIFVWDPMTLGYQRSIGLLGSPNAVAYDAVSGIIYVAYDSGLIYSIDLTGSEPKEVPLARLQGRPMALVVAGDYLFAVDQSQGRYAHRVISKDGVVQSSKEYYDYSGEFVWDPANHSIYSLRSGYPVGLMYEPIDAMGHLLSPVYSSYYESTGFLRPIRFSSDWNTVMLGSGLLFDPKSLVRSPYALANSISDAVWFSGRWVTIRNIIGVPQLQEWISPTLEPVYVKQWTGGTAHSIQLLTSKRIVVTVLSNEGVPTFHILDEMLQAATVNNTWNNHDAPMDVDDDEFVSPLDILIMIDQINLYGSEQVINVGEHYCDVDDDGIVTPLDVLAVINWINIQESNESNPSGESNSETPPDELLASLVDSLLSLDRKKLNGAAWG